MSRPNTIDTGSGAPGLALVVGGHRQGSRRSGSLRVLSLCLSLALASVACEDGLGAQPGALDQARALPEVNTLHVPAAAAAEDSPSPSAPVVPTQLVAGVDGQPLPTLAPILAKVRPGVVNIAVRGRVATQRDPFFENPLFREFFGAPPSGEREFRSAGSGVIVDGKQGLVLTNHHVVRQADEITVTLGDGTSRKAELVGSDPEADIAVVRIQADGLVEVAIGNSDALQVGDFVIAIGNPFGLGQTVTSGIVSALGRTGLGIEGYEDFIQTDASINPGNSGGALINLRGELVGINTAIVSPAGGNVGIGFAIPINMANQLMSQIVEFGEVRRGQLGVLVQDLTPQLARAFGVEPGNGALIAQVAPGSGADKAGLQRGDVVVGINGEPVRNAAALRNAVGLQSVGEEVKLDVRRDGKSLEVSAVLSEPVPTAASLKKSDASLLDGIRFRQVGPSPLGQSSGASIEVVAIEPGTPAASAGLRPGDRILEVNGQRVQTLQDLQNRVAGQERLLLLVERGGGQLFLAIE